MTKSKPEPAVGRHRRPQGEQFVIGKVADDLDGLGTNAVLLDEQMLLDWLMHGQNLIRKSHAEFFLPEKNFEESATFSALELRSEGVWHRIMDVE